MKAFEVYLNGKLLATAGTGDGVLATIVSRSKISGEAFNFHLGGIDEATGEHVDWQVPTPHVGDEILIRIIETERVDSPTSRKPRDPNIGAEVKREIEALGSVAKRVAE